MDTNSVLNLWVILSLFMLMGMLLDARRTPGEPVPECPRNHRGRRRCPEERYRVDCGEHSLPPGEKAVVTSNSIITRRRRGSSCKWNFRTERESLLRVVCDVSQYGDSRCRSSYLIISDGNTRSNKLCGTKRSAGITSETRRLNVVAEVLNPRSASNFAFRCTVLAFKPFPTVPSSTPNATAAVSPKCKCGRTNHRRKIVGGSQVEPNEYPWQVALVRGNMTRPFCGGSIISDSWILTAAHCLVNIERENLSVVIGEHDWSMTSETEITRRIRAKFMIWHSDFRPSSLLLSHDIGLIQLEEALTFPEDNSVAPICLPRPFRDYPATNALVVGWGTTEDKFSGPSKFLRVAEVKTMTNKVCQGLVALKGIITPTMICAGDLFSGENPCRGDSGGPLLTRGEGCGGACLASIGIVSWGAFCNAGIFPTVYTRTNRYLDWINMFIRGSITCQVPE